MPLLSPLVSVYWVLVRGCVLASRAVAAWYRERERGGGGGKGRKERTKGREG